MIKLGSVVDLELDTKKGILVVNSRGGDSYIIQIPVEKITKVGKVVWDKKAGEKFKDVAEKKPSKEILFDRSSD